MIPPCIAVGLALFAALPVALAQDEAASRAGRFEELVAEWEEMRARWGTDEDADPGSDIETHVPRVLELAKADPKDTIARDALLWIVRRSFYAPTGPLADIKVEAMELLAEHHADDPIVGAVGMRLINIASPARERFLRRLVERARNRVTKGRALLSLAEYVKMKARVARGRPLTAEELKQWPSKPEPFLADLIASDPEPFRTEAERLFEQVIDDYADILFIGSGRTAQIEYYTAQGFTLGKKARQALSELRSLQVGQPAPEIVGEDAFGETFRLSDYRGKVVVLTFSGNWCGPCVRMYPLERELVERYEDEPFALLSVNTDEAVETLREAIESGEITWRCWWDGPPGGPITTEWNIQAYPTLYIIDHEGIIRYTQIHESIQGAVEALLSELHAESASRDRF